MSSLSEYLISVKNASRGIGLMVTTQRNARLYAIATVAVILAGLILPVQPLEWVGLALSTGLVWIAEAFNTAVEYHVDDTSPGYRSPAANIKDLAAGGVLLAALTAIAVGLLIFSSALGRFLS
jgi:diacylglycerol kinase